MNALAFIAHIDNNTGTILQYMGFGCRAALLIHLHRFLPSHALALSAFTATIMCEVPIYNIDFDSIIEEPSGN